MKSAEYWIRELQLEKHPEGGYFRETYRSGETIPAAALSSSHSGARPFATAIYFLLPAGEISAFHRLASDEVWHFYQGKSITIFEFKPGGELVRHCIGPQVKCNGHFQAVIPAGSWQAARIDGGSGYALVGCTVAPGFCFADFELAAREFLLEKYPQHRSLIVELCPAKSDRPGIRPGD